jgi:hypothetical protein
MKLEEPLSEARRAINSVFWNSLYSDSIAPERSTWYLLEALIYQTGNLDSNDENIDAETRKFMKQISRKLKVIQDELPLPIEQQQKPVEHIAGQWNWYLTQSNESTLINYHGSKKSEARLKYLRDHRRKNLPAGSEIWKTKLAIGDKNVQEC